MAKYAFFSVPAYGHVNPTLAVVQELVARGEQVTYYLPEEFRHTIEANGAQFHKLELPGLKAPVAGNVGGPMPAFMINMIQMLPSLLVEIIESLRTEQPDCIVYDFLTPWGQLAAQILHIPAIILRSSYAPSPSSKRLMAERMAAVGGQGPAQPAFPVEILKETQEQLDKIYAANDVPSIPIMTTMSASFSNAGALSICFIPRAFQPEGDTLDDHFVFVGPSILPRHEGLSFPIEKLGEKPLLYISLGTGFNNRADIYNASFKAFGDTQWQVVLARGKNVDPAALDPVPTNFIVSDYVPQLDVLQHARVFISHGGMNSTMESLYYGVPLVVLPQMMEQEMTARRVQELGLGVALNSKEVSADDLRSAVQQITHEPAYSERVQTMQQEINKAGGYRKAVDAIMGFTRRIAK